MTIWLIYLVSIFSSLEEQTNTIIDFEQIKPKRIFGFYGAESKIINNPHPDAVNPSEHVGWISKCGNDINYLGGVAVEFEPPIDLLEGSEIYFSIFSQKNSVVKVKLEDTTIDNFSFEKNINIDSTSQWNQYQVDFRNLNGIIDRIVFIFDSTSVNCDNYLFDDIGQIKF